MSGVRTRSAKRRPEPPTPEELAADNVILDRFSALWPDWPLCNQVENVWFGLIMTGPKRRLTKEGVAYLRANHRTIMSKDIPATNDPKLVAVNNAYLLVEAEMKGMRDASTGLSKSIQELKKALSQ